jgi:MFS family permease
MKNNQKGILTLACLSHALCHAYMLIFPVVLASIKREFDFNFLGVGTIGMVAYFFFGIGAVPAGLLIDRIGPKRMLTIGLFGMAVASMFMSLSQSTVILIGIAMFSLGCFASIHHPAALAMISMSFDEKKGKAFGIHAAAGSIGIASAPLIAGIILTQLTWRYTYLIFSLMGFLTALISMFVETPNLAERRVSEPVKKFDNPLTGPYSRNAGLIFFLLCLTSALFGLIYRGTLTYFPTHFSENGLFINDKALLVGSVTTIVLGIGAIGQYYGGVFSDRLKMKEYGTFLLFGLSTPLLIVIGTVQGIPLFAFSGLLSILIFTFQPIQNHLISEATQRSRRGISYGVNYGVLFGFGSIAASAGGWLIDHSNVNFLYILMGGVAFLGTFVVGLQLAIRTHGFLATAGSNLEEVKTES